MVAGLAPGGCLADPVVNIPLLFGPDGFFNIERHLEGVAWALKYPYTLPAITNALALTFSLILQCLDSGRFSKAKRIIEILE